MTCQHCRVCGDPITPGFGVNGVHQACTGQGPITATGGSCYFCGTDLSSEDLDTAFGRRICNECVIAIEDADEDDLID